MSRSHAHPGRRPRRSGRGADPHGIDDELMEATMTEPEIIQETNAEGEMEESMAKRSTGSPLRQDVQRIGDDFRKLGGHAKELAADARDYAKERVANVPETARNYIQERPLQSLAIALGVGAILGLLLFRRSG